MRSFFKLAHLQCGLCVKQITLTKTISIPYTKESSDNFMP